MFLRATRRRRSGSSSNNSSGGVVSINKNKANTNSQRTGTSVAFMPNINTSINKGNMELYESSHATSSLSVNQSEEGENNKSEVALQDNVGVVGNENAEVDRKADMPTAAELTSAPTAYDNTMSSSPPPPLLSPEIGHVEERLKIIKRSRVSQSSSTQREPTTTAATTFVDEKTKQLMYSVYPVVSHTPQSKTDEERVQSMVRDCLDVLIFHSSSTKV